MPFFLNDTFTDTAGTAISSHVGETGASWAAAPASTHVPVISDINNLRNPTTGSALGVYYASGIPATPDYEVETSIFIFSVAINTAGVNLRMATGADTRYRAMYNGFTGQWEMYKTVVGVQTALGVPFAQSLSATTSYVLKFRAVGTSLTLYVDGVSRVTATDSDIVAAGRAGIELFGTMDNTNGPHLEYITGNDLGSAALPFITTVGAQRLGY